MQTRLWSCEGLNKLLWMVLWYTCVTGLWMNATGCDCCFDTSEECPAPYSTLQDIQASENSNISFVLADQNNERSNLTWCISGTKAITDTTKWNNKFSTSPEGTTITYLNPSTNDYANGETLYLVNGTECVHSLTAVEIRRMAENVRAYYILLHVVEDKACPEPLSSVTTVATSTPISSTFTTEGAQNLSSVATTTATSSNSTEYPTTVIVPATSSSSIKPTTRYVTITVTSLSCIEPTMTVPTTSTTNPAATGAGIGVPPETVNVILGAVLGVVIAVLVLVILGLVIKLVRLQTRELKLKYVESDVTTNQQVVHNVRGEALDQDEDRK